MKCLQILKAFYRNPFPFASSFEPTIWSTECADEFHGQREDDGRVLLRRDGVEGLEVPGAQVGSCHGATPKLEGGGGLGDDVGGLLESLRGLLLTLTRNHLAGGVQRGRKKHIALTY